MASGRHLVYSCLRTRRSRELLATTRRCCTSMASQPVDSSARKGIRERSRTFASRLRARSGSPLPPLAEQAAIVRFLDHADRRIRRYIRAKQKLIKLLEEQKQAIIHRAVTRGLDPNVRLKPSGVDGWGTCRSIGR